MRQLRTGCRATSSGLAMNSCAHAAPDIFVSVERNFDRCARSATQVKGDRLMRNRPRVPVGPVKAPRASAQPNRPRRCGAPSALSRLRSGEWARRLGMVLHRRDHARPQRSRHAAQRPDPALLLIAAVRSGWRRSFYARRMMLARNRKFVDSPLEGNGFEFSVPHLCCPPRAPWREGRNGGTVQLDFFCASNHSMEPGAGLGGAGCGFRCCAARTSSACWRMSS